MVKSAMIVLLPNDFCNTGWFFLKNRSFCNRYWYDIVVFLGNLLRIGKNSGHSECDEQQAYRFRYKGARCCWLNHYCTIGRRAARVYDSVAPESKNNLHMYRTMRKDNIYMLVQSPKYTNETQESKHTWWHAHQKLQETIEADPVGDTHEHAHSHTVGQSVSQSLSQSLS